MISYNTKYKSGNNPDFQNHPQKQNGSGKSFPSRTLIHPKLELTEPGDSDEQEADVAASEVMSGKVCRKISGGGAGGGMAVSSQMESQLNHLQGGGQTMPAGLRGMMERGFDRDFSQVRLHTDSEAAGLSSSIHAKAFTHGNDIYFNRGQFSPETSEGQRLVAHELAHVAQGGGKVGRKPGNNYKLITLALIASPKAGGKEFYGDSGFEYKDENDNKINDFKCIFLDEGMSVSDIAKKLVSSVGKDEYVQNLIISGHGEWFGIALSTLEGAYSGPCLWAKNNSSMKEVLKCDDKDAKKEGLSVVDIRNPEESKSFFNAVVTVMSKIKKLNRPIPQSIILNSCSTNSHVYDEKMKDEDKKSNFRDVLDLKLREKKVYVTIYSGNAPMFAGKSRIKLHSDGTLELLYNREIKGENGVVDTQENKPSYYTIESSHFTEHEGTNIYKRENNTNSVTSIFIIRETANAFHSLLDIKEALDAIDAGGDYEKIEELRGMMTKRMELDILHLKQWEEFDWVKKMAEHYALLKNEWSNNMNKEIVCRPSLFELINGLYFQLIWMKLYQYYDSHAEVKEFLDNQRNLLSIMAIINLSKTNKYTCTTH
ncbi:MAG: DUF4157 domain-containing protein [Paludibacteraceae bacterium]|nr:DUF4157 domain-containing protein [Paludibacteraceae bacterium]